MRSPWWVATLVICGCTDGSRGTEPMAGESLPPQPVVSGLRGIVDVRAGMLTFASLRSASPAHVRPAGIYGDQGVTVTLYNSPVTIATSSTPGKETYTANVGLRNLLAFPIGDHAVPLRRSGERGLAAAT